ncbi:hypothetical protein SK128_025517 [Halocaridina rubra]|uniref:CHK kinase-like domain-containing protein n=1 Tax=Halocaridina rubra TaxID=373956 RepID=A0AAN9A838_HALRR
MSSKLEPLSCIEDVNQQWIERMLTPKFGASITVQSWSYRIPASREGFMSDIAYLHILCCTAEGQQKNLRLVLKVLPKDKDRRQFMIRGGLDKREIYFYNFIMSKEFQVICSDIKLVLPVPDVYYAGYVENAVTLVMGDLSFKKFKSVIIPEGTTLNQTKIAFQALGRIHAAGLIYINKYGEKCSNLAEVASVFNNDFYDEFFVPNLETMIKMYKNSPQEEIIKALVPKTKEMIYLRNRYPLLKTVIHGDFWAGQLMYSDDESEAIVIDWQYCSINNAASDILSMFFMSCSPHILEYHLDEVLKSYWNSLQAVMEAAAVAINVTYEEFRENIENLWLYGFMMIAISIHDFLGAGNLTHERLHGYIDFLYRKGVFAKFITMIEHENREK